MNIVAAIDDYLKKAELGMIVLFLSVMVVLAFLQVVLRNVFSAGIVWADIVLRHLVLWLGFLGGVLATSNHRHLNIDAFAHFMSERVRASVGVVTNLFGAGICVLLAQASIRFVQGEMEAHSFVLEQIPSWYVQIIIPLGFSVHVIHFLIRSAVSARDAMKKGSPA